MNYQGNNNNNIAGSSTYIPPFNMAVASNTATFPRFCGNIEDTVPDRNRHLMYDVCQWLADTDDRIASCNISDESSKIKEAISRVNPELGDAYPTVVVGVLSECKSYDDFKKRCMRIWQPRSKVREFESQNCSQNVPSRCDLCSNQLHSENIVTIATISRKEKKKFRDPGNSVQNRNQNQDQGNVGHRKGNRSQHVGNKSQHASNRSQYADNRSNSRNRQANRSSSNHRNQQANKRSNRHQQVDKKYNPVNRSKQANNRNSYISVDTSRKWYQNIVERKYFLIFLMMMMMMIMNIMTIGLLVRSSHL